MQAVRGARGSTRGRTMSSLHRGSRVMRDSRRRRHWREAGLGMAGAVVMAQGGMGTLPTCVLCAHVCCTTARCTGVLHAFRHAARVFCAHTYVAQICATHTRMLHTYAVTPRMYAAHTLDMLPTHTTNISVLYTHPLQIHYTHALNCTPICYVHTLAAHVCYTQNATIFILHTHTCCIHILCIYTLQALHFYTQTYAAHPCTDPAHTYIHIYKNYTIHTHSHIYHRAVGTQGPVLCFPVTAGLRNSWRVLLGLRSCTTAPQNLSPAWRPAGNNMSHSPLHPWETNPQGDGSQIPRFGPSLAG